MKAYKNGSNIIHSQIITKSNNCEKQKFNNLLFCTISVLPPNIFMFHLYSNNAEYVDFWHIFIVAVVLSIGALMLYWFISRIGKSSQGSALVCVFLWIVFFTLHPLYNNFDLLYLSELSLALKFLFLLIPVAVFTVLIFKVGHRIKHKEIFKILAVFEVVVFFLIFIQTSVINVSSNITVDSENNYKTSFIVDSTSPSPNIYWLFMDGMLGFKAMEYIFNDPQMEFENKLNERGFLVNREAEFEAAHSTANAIPALMCPFFYDKVMFPLVVSMNPSINRKKRSYFYGMITDIFAARVNNELITAFNMKGYQTNTIAGLSYFFFPTTDTFYTQNGRIDYDAKNILIVRQLANLGSLADLMLIATPLFLIKNQINGIISAIYYRYLNIESVRESNIDKNKIYGDFYGGDKWHINALSEIFNNTRPQLTILHDLKAHYPFILTEDGSFISRIKNENLDIYNYPTAHRYVQSYLVALIDLILVNDPEAVIIIQADHGLHSSYSQEQILSSGGTEDEVRLIYNQTMNAVRIPDKWGGLDAPLDPLNITRVLVNRYVGQNYELLESHP